MTEPLLQCQVCRHTYRERDAHRASKGRWAGQLIGPPPNCRHPLTFAWYVDPASHALLLPYGTPEPTRWATPPQAVQYWQAAHHAA